MIRFIAVASVGISTRRKLPAQCTHTRTSTANRPSVLIALEFTGDGAADIVTGNDGSTVSLLAGRGDGTFFHRVDHAVNFAPRSTVAGDFSGDGKPDVAARR